MEATTERIVGSGTTPTGLVPGVMMKKQVLEYLKRTRLRRADLRTIAAELGLTKREHNIVGKVLRGLEVDSLVVKVEDDGQSYWRLANAGEERRPPGLFDRMVEGHAAREVEPAVEPDPGLKERTCGECGFVGANVNGLKVHMSTKHKDADIRRPCAICGRMIDPRGLRTHMRSHDLAQAISSTPKPAEPPEEEEDEDEDLEEEAQAAPRTSELATGFENIIEDAARRGWVVELLHCRKPYNGGMIKLSYTNGDEKGVRL